MSNPYQFGKSEGVDALTSTHVHDNGDAYEKPRDKSMQEVCCKVALGGVSGSLLTSEIAPLLRYRLRLAATVTLVTFIVLLIRAFLQADNPGGASAFGLALHSVIVAVMIVLTAVLWTTQPMSVRALRTIELMLFGMPAVFFTYLHFVAFDEGRAVTWAAPEHRSKVVSLAMLAENLRWFVLIVLYGTFIPNTWKRCATVVTVLVAIPFSLAVMRCTICEYIAPSAGLWPIIDSAIVLGLAATIAIFGSYKISVLERQAVAARELGQYRLKRKLGAGGMGEVYLAEHVMLQRQCAIKLIRPDQAGDAITLQRFEREVQAMATLTHWNSVEIYDYGLSEDGTFYYAMEYLPGLSLQELVEKHGPLPPQRAVHFLTQVCSALQEAHSLGIIHRDIKPSNVIACERGGKKDVSKLLDFGLVQCLGDCKQDSKLTVQGVILGSPPYMAPEQALGKSNLDARTDIYSVGALAYFLLTGRPPFVREGAMELLVAHAHEKPTPLTDFRSDVPKDLQAVVLKCLEKAPAQRYESAEELELAFARCDCADLWTRHSAATWWEKSARATPAAEVEALIGS